MSIILDPLTIAIIVIAVVVLLVLAIFYGIRAHRRKVTAGREELIGRVAEVRVTLDPKGMVFVDGEHWAAVSESGRIEAGQEVVVTRVDGLKLWVSNKK